ncbi:MAG: carboxymuconolactone decarboxylase family protein [Candidatus Aenigmatarchaeota archaeon]
MTNIKINSEHDIVNDFLETMKKKAGQVTEPMKILAELAPDIIVEHARSQKFAMKEGKIPSKYKLLIALACSVAIGNESCVDTYAKIAKRSGISKDEVLEAILIARFELASSTFSRSLPALKEFKEQ